MNRPSDHTPALVGLVATGKGWGRGEEKWYDATNQYLSTIVTDKEEPDAVREIALQRQSLLKTAKAVHDQKVAMSTLQDMLHQMDTRRDLALQEFVRLVNKAGRQDKWSEDDDRIYKAVHADLLGRLQYTQNQKERQSVVDLVLLLQNSRQYQAGLIDKLKYYETVWRMKRLDDSTPTHISPVKIKTRARTA